MTVTMHMSRVSQARSVLSGSSSSVGDQYAQTWAAYSVPSRPAGVPALPSRISGTETSETQSILSPLHVPTNVAAPCGIARVLAGGDRNKITRRYNCLFLAYL